MNMNTHETIQHAIWATVAVVTLVIGATGVVRCEMQRKDNIAACIANGGHPLECEESQR